MSLKLYELDRIAQKLVLKYRDQKDVLNESHKMRTTATFGLERFWGEHLRLLGNGDKNATDKAKGSYWKDTWQEFVNIMKQAEIEVPKGDVEPNNTKDITETAQQFWNQQTFPLEDQRIALAILTQLCDSLVWWTQRYKKKSQQNGKENNHEL